MKTRLKKTALAGVAALLLLVPLTGCGGDEARFNAWIAACMAEGGHISPTSFDSDGPRWYECFRDDQVIQVPGFEDED